MFDLWRRECLLYLRQPSLLVHYLGFFFVVVFLFVFALGVDLVGREAVAAAIIWSVFVLSSLMVMPHIYIDDLLDGCLEQYYLLGKGLILIVLYKLLFYSLFIVLPLLILLPVLLYFLAVENAEFLWRLWLGVAIGGPVVVLFNHLVAALTLGVSRNIQLLAILLFPLLLPVLIFSILWTLSGEQWVLHVLIALLAFVFPLTVWGSVYGIRNALNYE